MITNELGESINQERNEEGNCKKMVKLLKTTVQIKRQLANICGGIAPLVVQT